MTRWCGVCGRHFRQQARRGDDDGKDARRLTLDTCNLYDDTEDFLSAVERT